MALSSMAGLARRSFAPLGLRRFSLLAAYESKIRAEGFLPDACQTKCLNRLEELKAALLKPDSKAATTPRGLYMYGGVGTGKTMMLDLFHQEVTAAGLSCERQHFHEFLQAMHRRLHLLRKRVGPQQGLLARLAEEYKEEFPVLAFDEAHVLNVGDALMLRAFFEAYFKAGGVMVATSNVAPDDLYASGINREVFLPFLDALKERCDFFEMQGRHDYRGRAVEAGRFRGTYLWQDGDMPAIGASSPDGFRGLREALSLPEGSSCVQETVDVDVGFGRTLRCEKTWTYTTGCDATGLPETQRVVQFDFDELCRTATGPSEWVGLAEFSDAIVVTGVPHFAVHDEDCARRFTTFVDIVYDKQRFLVVTADVSPERIFSKFVEKYAGDELPSPSSATRPPAKTAPEEPTRQMKMPAHGLGSGRHGVVFQRPKQLQYGASGAYITTASAATDEEEAPVPHAVSTTRTGGMANRGSGDLDKVMTGIVMEDTEWVEWSATGLLDASLFDLSPVTTDTQVTDKLLPFRRCASRLFQMQSRKLDLNEA